MKNIIIMEKMYPPAVHVQMQGSVMSVEDSHGNTVFRMTVELIKQSPGSLPEYRQQSQLFTEETIALDTFNKGCMNLAGMGFTIIQQVSIQD